ncbi:hypothetical protein BLOT_005761 [Blomia tropicalis]|nr:hypothetical protein BLOT_005761 [Blomia tropicalis]
MEWNIGSPDKLRSMANIHLIVSFENRCRLDCSRLLQHTQAHYTSMSFRVRSTHSGHITRTRRST